MGELNLDLILERVQALPELGTERRAEGMTLTLGSSSAILASNASALGLEVGFVGRVGDDGFADQVMEHLRDRGLDTRHVYRTPEVSTGLTVIYTHREDRGMITYPGAMEALTIEDVPWEYVQRADHLHLSSLFLQQGLRPDVGDLFRRARELGLSTSLDTNWDPDESWDDGILDVLEHVDVFLPNDEEARLLAGTDDLDRALEVLAERAGAVVATCGAEGVRGREATRTFSVETPTVEPVDAVGAGDSFNAGFLKRYLQGASLEACAELGVLTGAFSTLEAGGTAAFDDPEAFEEFVAERRPPTSDS